MNFDGILRIFLFLLWIVFWYFIVPVGMILGTSLFLIMEILK